VFIVDQHIKFQVTNLGTGVLIYSKYYVHIKLKKPRTYKILILNHSKWESFLKEAVAVAFYIKESF